MVWPNDIKLYYNIKVVYPDIIMPYLTIVQSPEILLPYRDVKRPYSLTL